VNFTLSQQKVFLVAFYQIYRVATDLIANNAALDGIFAWAKARELVAAPSVGEHTSVDFWQYQRSTHDGLPAVVVAHDAFYKAMAVVILTIGTQRNQQYNACYKPHESHQT